MDQKEERTVLDECHLEICRRPPSGDRKDPELGQRTYLDNQVIDDISHKQYLFDNKTGSQPPTVNNHSRGVNSGSFSSNASESDRSRLSSSWQSRRIYPAGGSSIIPAPCQIDNVLPHDFVGSPQSERVDYSGFINSMDDPAFAYFSLVREYALRRLQGNALQYEGFYRAMAGQGLIDERQSRITVIEFEEVGSRSKTFDDYKDIRDYLDGRPSREWPRRLFLLEDLPVRIVCLLGSRLKIHPSVFANHYSSEDSSTASDDIAALPSVYQHNTRDGRDYASLVGSSVDTEKRRFTLRYPIIMPRVSASQSPDPKLCPSWLKPSSRLTDQSAYPRFVIERGLGTPTLHDKWDARGQVSELEGQVSYWSHINCAGGWDSLLLVDPCLKDPDHLAMLGGTPRTNLSRIVRYPELDDHEKVDLTPNPLQWHPSAAFTKYILHDDILTHFSVADAGPGVTPVAVTPFVRGFAISKWVAHLNHVRRCFTNTGAALFSSGNILTTEGTAQHTARWGADWKEWMFEAMTRLVTDLMLYRLDVETNMRALGIKPDQSDSYGIAGQREAEMWRYIRDAYIHQRFMFESLTNSYIQVVALREAQASNIQARSVRWLTILGTFFVPLSVVAGIMSMGADFLPGKDYFWVYFAVIVPLLLVIGTVLLGLTKGHIIAQRLHTGFFGKIIRKGTVLPLWKKDEKIA